MVKRCLGFLHTKLHDKSFRKDSKRFKYFSKKFSQFFRIHAVLLSPTFEVCNPYASVGKQPGITFNLAKVSISL